MMFNSEDRTVTSRSAPAAGALCERFPTARTNRHPLLQRPDVLGYVFALAVRAGRPAIRIALVFTSIVVFAGPLACVQAGAVAEPGERRINREPTGRLGGWPCIRIWIVRGALSNEPNYARPAAVCAVITTLLVLTTSTGCGRCTSSVFQIAASLLAIVVFGIHINAVASARQHVITLAWASRFR